MATVTGFPKSKHSHIKAFLYAQNLILKDQNMSIKTASAETASGAASGGSRAYLLLLTGVAALGGLLFGYDTAVISGAVGFLQRHFHLSAGLTGWAASSVLVGAMIGAAAGGPLSDRIGRRPVLLLCAVLFAISGVLTALAASLDQYILMRLLGGIAIGAISVVSPLYIAETAPERVRGQLVSLYQLAIVSGILVVFFVNLLIQRQGTEAWDVAYGWRWMFGSLALPALLLGGLVLTIPESPRWLIKTGRREEAQAILTRIGGLAEAERELVAIERTASAEKSGSLAELLAPGFRRALLIGVSLAVLCQFSGINAIMYYAPEIFKASGAGVGSAFTQTLLVGAVNLLFTFAAIRLIDRVGRRPLLLVGSAVQVLALSGVGLAFGLGLGGVFLLLPILLFIAAFAAGMGPVPWVVISEIFPTRIRGGAMAAATLVLWIADFAVAQTFPLLNAGIGPAWTFGIYAGCSLVGLLFVWKVVVETKGRSLEEIERAWRPDAASKAL
jgi:SP family arabinose:H+ symporter-like MFS transporter